MNKIEKQLQIIKKSKKGGLMTHVVVGYPTLDATVPLIQTLAETGSDFVELQIPFSDPIADGPTIMKACDRALKQGITVDDCFSVMKQASKKVSTPLLFMGYYNTVFHYGVEKFCKKASEMGASGLIFPDMPPDEETHESFTRYAQKYGLYPIRVVTPASSDERLKLNAFIAKGFVYCVSRFGVTGAHKNLDSQLDEYVRRVKKYFDIPIALGFGISKKKHIEVVRKYADIAIVGSAIIEIIEKNKKISDALSEIKFFVKKLKI